MRFGAAVFLGAALLVAGCDPVAENKLFREGIGTDLSRPELAEATRLQDLYIGYMCQQGGLEVVREGDAIRCANLPAGSRNWAVVVQAGLNDIDQRCDAYLAWLDDRRRSKAPILSQINAMQTATQSIMRVAGRGADPITIVGLAFGLASDTFTNVNSRLLLEVNHSTVQAVVLNRRTEYRFKNRDVKIDNRPAAIHVLRSYLNICMPFTIEMAINTNVTAFELGGADALARASMLATAAVPVPTVRSNQPPPVTPPVSNGIRGAVTNIEKNSISSEDARTFQRVLCVPDTGEFGPQTRSALKGFNAAFLLGSQIEPKDLLAKAPDAVVTNKNLDDLKLVRKEFSVCKGFANGFEAGVFGRFGFAAVRGQIEAALRSAQLPVPASLAKGGAVLDNDLRGAIKALRASFDKGRPVPGKPELDPEFYDWILNASDLNARPR